MKTATICFALSLLFTVACAPQVGEPVRTTTTSSAEILDGRSYVIEGTLPGGEALSSDLSFARGHFDSSACHAFGFEAGPYTVRRDGEALSFVARMQNKSGVETWRGRIVGDGITGDVTGPDGITIAYRGHAR